MISSIDEFRAYAQRCLERTLGDLQLPTDANGADLLRSLQSLVKDRPELKGWTISGGTPAAPGEPAALRPSLGKALFWDTSDLNANLAHAGSEDPQAPSQRFGDRVQARFILLLRRMRAARTSDVLHRAISEIVDNTPCRWIAMQVDGISPGDLHVIDEDTEIQGVELFEPDVYADSDSLIWACLLKKRHRDGVDVLSHREPLRNLMELVRLVTLAPLRERFAFYVYDDGYEGEVDSDRSRIGPDRGGVWIQDDTNLTESHTRRIAEHWPSWPRHFPTLAEAIDPLREGIKAETPDKSVSWAMASLEALLAPDAASHGSPYASDLITSRAPKLLEKQETRRKYIGAAIRRAYGVRSERFHKGRSNIVDERMSSLQSALKFTDEQRSAWRMLRIASDCILELHDLLAGGLTRELILVGLDDPRR